MAEMLEQLQLAVSTLGQDRSTEWLHDFLDRHRLIGQLVSRRAVCGHAELAARSAQGGGYGR